MSQEYSVAPTLGADIPSTIIVVKGHQVRLSPTQYVRFLEIGQARFDEMVQRQTAQGVHPTAAAIAVLEPARVISM